MHHHHCHRCWVSGLLRQTEKKVGVLDLVCLQIHVKCRINIISYVYVYILADLPAQRVDNPCSVKFSNGLKLLKLY